MIKIDDILIAGETQKNSSFNPICRTNNYRKSRKHNIATISIVKYCVLFRKCSIPYHGHQCVSKNIVIVVFENKQRKSEIFVSCAFVWQMGHMSKICWQYVPRFCVCHTHVADR